MKRFLVGGLLLLAALPAAAQDWRAVQFEGEDTENFRLVYLDVAAVKRTSDTGRQMTIANFFGKRQTLGPGSDYDWLEVTYALDCARSTAKAILSKGMTPTRTVATSDTVGNEIPFLTNVAFNRATKAVCSGDYSGVTQRAPALAPHAAERFAHRQALIASARSSNWARVGLSAQSGTNLAMFVDRGSVLIDAGNQRRATIMMISEKSGAVSRFLSRLWVDCNTGMRRQILSDSYSTSRLIRIFPDDAPAPLVAGTVFGAIREPICTADYSRARAYALTPDAIAPTAFVR